MTLRLQSLAALQSLTFEIRLTNARISLREELRLCFSCAVVKDFHNTIAVH